MVKQSNYVIGLMAAAALSFTLLHYNLLNRESDDSTRKKPEPTKTEAKADVDSLEGRLWSSSENDSYKSHQRYEDSQEPELTLREQELGDVNNWKFGRSGYYWRMSAHAPKGLEGNIGSFDLYMGDVKKFKINGVEYSLKLTGSPGKETLVASSPGYSTKGPAMPGLTIPFESPDPMFSFDSPSESPNSTFGKVIPVGYIMTEEIRVRNDPNGPFRVTVYINSAEKCSNIKVK
ncbi:hypothetical protein ACFLYT_01100 [Nanoarchaeota archaeon]